MDTLRAVWKWIECNRFTVLAPLLAISIWLWAGSCTPSTPDPLDESRLVNAKQLEVSYKQWQSGQEIVAAKFEAAGEDLATQAERNAKIEQLVIGLASGGVPDMPGLLKLLFASGLVGAVADNVRKRAVISGLKIQKKPA